MKWLVVTALLGIGPAMAEDAHPVEVAVRALFDDMPKVVFLSEMDARCGADAHTNPFARYCTSANEIYLLRDEDEDALAYRMAHLMGHAAQVRHGIADIALREVRRRPDEEVALRHMVTRQVECLAGVFVAGSGFGTLDLMEIFTASPFDDAHWGRNPLRVGPVVTLVLKDRAVWFEKGQREGIEACSSGEIDVNVLLNAPGYRG